MKYNEVRKMILKDGWFSARQNGSHITYKHNTKKGLVTLAGHRQNDEVPRGTLSNILRQAELK